MKTGGLVDDYMSNRPRKIAYDADRLLTAPGLRVSQGIKNRPDLEEPYYQDGDFHYVNRFNPDNIVKPVRGNVSIAYEMLKSLCRDSPSAIQKILTIAARHAQLPAITPKYAVLLTGEQRSGKSNMARLIGLSLCKDFSSARVSFDSDYNGGWAGKLCKEFAEFDPKMDEEYLKDLITAKTIEINHKYGIKTTEDNFTLYIFTCNGLQSKIQPEDGRFVIAGYSRPDDKRLGLEFEKWIDGPGPAYFRYHLLNEIDITEYDTMTTWTEMREAVIEASKSKMRTICDQIMDELNEVDGLECLPNVVLNELLRPYNVDVNWFNKRNGERFRKPKRENIRISGTLYRFRVFKNHDLWSQNDRAEDYHKQYEIATKYLSSKIKSKY